MYQDWVTTNLFRSRGWILGECETSASMNSPYHFTSLSRRVPTTVSFCHRSSPPHWHDLCACNVMTSLLLGVDLSTNFYHNNLTTGKTRT